MNRFIIILNSVGTGLDPVNGMIYPLLSNGGIDEGAGVHIGDCSPEWFNAMSDKDRLTVKANRLRANYAGRLPIYHMESQDYFVDFRLKELRPVDQPQKSFPFMFICDPQVKADLRALRAEFSTPCYMVELDS